MNRKYHQANARPALSPLPMILVGRPSKGPPVPLTSGHSKAEPVSLGDLPLNRMTKVRKHLDPFTDGDTLGTWSRTAVTNQWSVRSERLATAGLGGSAQRPLSCPRICLSLLLCWEASLFTLLWTRKAMHLIEAIHPINSFSKSAGNAVCTCSQRALIKSVSGPRPQSQAAGE